MKKIAIILLASWSCYWVSKPACRATSSHHMTINIINEAIFVKVIRDLELLNCWLLNSYFPEESIDKLRHQNQKKILASYEVHTESFKESVKHYLEASPEKALEIYEKVYLALEALSI